MLPRLWLLVGSDRPTDRPTDRHCHLLSCPGQLKRDDFLSKGAYCFRKKRTKEKIHLQKKLGRGGIPSPVADDSRHSVFDTSFWPLPCFGGVLKLACMTLVGALFKWAISWFWGSKFLSGWFCKRAIEMNHGFFCLGSTGGGEESNPIVFFFQEKGIDWNNNWFKIDIHQQLRPLTANYLAMFKVTSTTI